MEHLQLLTRALQYIEENLQGSLKTEDVAAKALEYAFDFMEQAFENGQEMIVFVTELTLGKEAVMFLAEHTCERYMKYNRELLIGTKKAELLSEINRDEV